MLGMACAMHGTGSHLYRIINVLQNNEPLAYSWKHIALIRKIILFDFRDEELKSTAV